jgi:CheY-like chemotaxis protein
MTKIIGMSGRLTEGQVSQFAGRGYDAILRKPFTVRQVIEAIESAHAIVA